MTLIEERIEARIQQHFNTVQLGGYEDEDYHKATVTDAMLEFAINELKMVIKWIREEAQEQEQQQSIKLTAPENKT
jgi:FtsZ-binding cell division protein ZapB